MLSPGIHFRELCDVYADEENTGIVIYFHCNDGGRGALYLDRAEIDQRSFQFEESQRVPEGMLLQ